MAITNKYAKNFRNGSTYYDWKLLGSSYTMGCGYYNGGENWVFCEKFTITDRPLQPLRLRIAMTSDGGYGDESVSWNYKFFTSESEMNNYKNASTSTKGDGTVTWNKGDSQVTTLSFNRQFAVGTHYVAFWRTTTKSCEIRWTSSGNGGSNWCDVGGDAMYKISFTGDAGYNSASNQGYHASGSSVSVQVASKAGYTLKSMTGTQYDGSSGGNWTGCAGQSSYTSTWSIGTHDRSVYVNTTANTYTVKYNGNGNTGGSTASSSHTYGTAKALTANGFTKTGYTFSGWATSASGSKVYSDKQSVSNLTTTNGGTVNLYAVWTENKYTLTINPNGGSYKNSTSSTTVSNLTYESYYEINNLPTRAGYSFVGWKPSGSGNIWSGYAISHSSEITRTVKTDSDGTIYTNYKFSQTNSGTGTKYYAMTFFNYNFTAGHIYQLSYDIRVNSISGFHYWHIRHSAFSNNWQAPAIQELGAHGWLHRTINNTLQSTTTQNGNNYTTAPQVECYVALLSGKTGSFDIDIKNISVFDVTGNCYVTSKANVKNGSTFYVQGNTSIQAIWQPSGVVYIDNGSSFDAYQLFIDNGKSWDQYIPYIDNGTSYDMY